MRLFVLAVALVAIACAGATKSPGAATITGQITSGGKPVPHAVVVVDYQGTNIAARADAGGRFTVENAPTGRHDVFTFADGYIYDHGGFPNLKPGLNDHSRKLIHVGTNAQEPAVTDITWSSRRVKPGGKITIAATWTMHDKSGISDELFAFVPEFKHPAIFGVGTLHRGKNPSGHYSATLEVPRDAKPGEYTAYIFGAQESCFVNSGWPTARIIVSP